MNSLLKNFLQKTTFKYQLNITVTLGILLLALFSTLTGSWLSNERVRENIIEQGQRITESLAKQSELALIYGSPENAQEATATTMAFPGVLSVEIIDIEKQVLLTRITGDRIYFEQGLDQDKWAQHQGASLVNENRRGWRFLAPVYTRPPSQSPFDAQSSEPELLGHVMVVMSKEALFQTAKNIFIANMMTSFSFAFLFLFLIRFLTSRMTQPLKELSASMELAKEGETEVRAELVGPVDITNMAHIFNSMMTVLEEREADLRVAAIAFDIEEGMIVTDQNATILRVNRVFSQVSGYRAEEVIGKNLGTLKSNHEDAEFYQRIFKILRKEKHWQGEIWNRRKCGETYPEWLTINAVIGKNDEVTNYICAFFDITERKKAEEKIHNLAFYDPLCQLPNRRLFFDRLHQAVNTSVRSKTCAGLLFIDIDNFKILNDTQGHEIGDLLLVEVGKRLSSCVRKSDTLARLGGDEFVVLLEGLSEDWSEAAVQAREVGEKVLDKISIPYMLKNIEYFATASIGVSLFNKDKQHLDDLLKQADTAMYAAKKDGRNTLRFFDPEMQKVLETRSQFEFLMRKALQENKFKLFYQVQVDSKQRPVGAEALIRWKHPEQGTMADPDEFIPIAEDTGLILSMGLWILKTACAQLKEWEQNPLTSELTLAINVSAKEFHQANFVKQVHDVIKQSAIDPTKLILELTESTLLDHVIDTTEKMHALKALGIRFSMDDFGTGYSSLAYLTQLPLDQLKIDKTFIKNIGIRPTDSLIIQTIIGMANNLGIELIAEGVEEETHLKFLLDAGCSFYQGYLFGSALPIKEFTNSLEVLSSRASS